METIIAESLKKVRKQHKLTQQDIADVLGVDRSTYTFYETGKTLPSVVTLRKLADIYNVTVGYLAGFEENRPELKVKKVSSAVAYADADPLARLSKEEQIILMCYRVAKNETKQDIIRYVKNVSRPQND